MQLSNQEILLANVIANRKSWEEANRIGVTAENFSDDIQRDAWTSIATSEKDNQPHLATSFAVRCKHEGTRNLISTLLAGISEFRTGDLEQVARLVISEGRAKELSILATQVATDMRSFAAGQDMASLVRAFNAMASKAEGIYDISGKQQTDPAKDSYDFTANLEKIVSGGDQSISTGIKPLDDSLGGGWLPNHYVLVAGRTGIGKTQFAVNAANNAYMNGHKTLFFSSEMTKNQLMFRLMSRAANIDSRRLTSMTITEAETDRLHHAVKNFSDKSMLLMYDSFDRKIDNIEAIVARECRSRVKPKLVIVDYAQILIPSERLRDNLQNLQEISSRMKAIAQRYPVCLILLAQLNREAMGEAPELGHIRGNDSFAHDCDSCILLHSDEISKELGFGWLRMRKMRYGIENNIPVNIDLSVSKYSEMEKDVFSGKLSEYAVRKKALDQQAPRSFKKKYYGKSHSGMADN